MRMTSNREIARPENESILPAHKIELAVAHVIRPAFLARPDPVSLTPSWRQDGTARQNSCAKSGWARARIPCRASEGVRPIGTAARVPFSAHAVQASAGAPAALLNRAAPSAWRSIRGIPLRDLAQRIDISPAYWSRIERQMEKAPKNELMERAAQVLGLDLDEVFIEASRLPPDMQRDVRGVVQAYRKFKQAED
jgi:DNA-binding XRE family transcriptional regulator